MIKHNRHRNSAQSAARAVAITGVLLVISVYAFALTIRGPDVGDSNGCRSTYSDAPALQSDRDAYQAILDKADPNAVVDWTSTWSYFPPGWVCSTRGLDSEGQALGVLYPSKWGGVAVLVGMVLAAGGAVSMAALWIREHRGSSRI